MPSDRVGPHRLSIQTLEWIDRSAQVVGRTTTKPGASPFKMMPVVTIEKVDEVGTGTARVSPNPTLRQKYHRPSGVKTEMTERC